MNKRPSVNRTEKVSDRKTVKETRPKFKNATDAVGKSYKKIVSFPPSDNCHLSSGH